ncbi:bacillithiol biosynthesis cysteine-adding enzyme BshC [Flammeovirga agarivorans]|uniref:Putative cysteine ligase BshC n=1 Tax=Flammeovirga agarivorans TaxID=2726742 RepID=A0A7X8SID9_9BACT|nr:bacillithiol biosynthesis cysteine-adding enzyme BshC [Flammeovirga agarivorans]NLR90795.1 bacillithiol biosynthesis cysteine-adding enzyme BshC [Flammeovirga agarivorans]
MNSYKIPFETAGLYGKMFLDYLNGKEALTSLYKYKPTLDSFDQIISDRKHFSTEQRILLVDSLKEQYQNIEGAPMAQIDLLQQENTFTIVTGHQLNIFTGPLFFIYKIAAAIHLANELKEKHPEYNFVPVYWMATEDHDFEEIASFQLGKRKYTWEHPQTGGPVGRLNLDGINDILDQIKDMPNLFVDAYRKHETLTEATRYYVNALFGEYGLVCIDADSPELKTPFKEVMKKEIFDQKGVRQVEKANHIIEELGYKTQIHARDINLFYMEDTERLRLESVGDKIQTVGGDYQWTKEEMLSLIENHPEKLSPNVVLRPVLQEILLPNLAYLGGPAEVIYWLQLKGVFDMYDVNFPMVLPRGFNLILNQQFAERWKKTGWDLSELLQPVRKIEEKVLEDNTSVVTDIDEQVNEMNKLYEQLMMKAKAISPNLEKHILAEQIRTQKRLEHTHKKLRKEGKRKLRTDIERITCIRECLLPNNAPQERVENLMEYWPKQPDLIPELIKELNPLSFNLNVLVEE